MDPLEPFDFKPIEQDSQDEIIGRIREQLASGDSEAVRRAVLGLGWLESGEEMVEPLLRLATDGTPEIAAVALEGLARIGSPQAEQPLARLVLELLRSNEQSHLEVRAEAIRSLGKVGGKDSSRFLVEIVRSPAPATFTDREAAVEAMVSLADRGVESVSKLLEELAGETEGELAKALEAAVRELNLQQWEDKGFLTIEADLEENEDIKDGT